MAQTLILRGLIDSLDFKPDEFLIPLYEVVTNALQSIEDVKTDRDGEILIEINRSNQEEIKGKDFEGGYRPIIGFTVSDNGVGFTQKRYQAFNEAFTEMNIKKGCRGIGRYTILACFVNMDVNSTFEEDKVWYNRNFKFGMIEGIKPENDENRKRINGSENHKTTIRLNNYKKQFHDYTQKQKIDINHIAKGILQHFLLYFKDDNTPSIYIYNADEGIEKALLLNEKFDSIIKFDKKDDKLKISNIDEPFLIKYIKNYEVRSHSAHLCANNREVGEKINLSKYIPSLVKSFVDNEQGNFHLSLYVTGKYLDTRVNIQRNKFSIPLSNEDKNSFDLLSIDELLTNVSEKVKNNYSEWIKEADKEKMERIYNYILDTKKPRLAYKHLLDIENIFDDIPNNITDDKLETELHKKAYQLEVKRKKAFEKFFQIKKYDKDDFGKIVHDVLKQEAAFSKGKLADLLINRKSIIKLFRKYLEWKSDENYWLEEDLHNIIFTMGAETDNMSLNFHNLWLLDERLSFHSYTTSDKQIRKTEKIKSSSQKEPDLLIYDLPWAYSDNPKAINSLVIFEFKRPGRDMNTPKDKKLDSQVEEYFIKLMDSKEKSETGNYLNIQDDTPKFGYIICDLHTDLISYNIKHNYFKKTPYGTLYKINSELNQYFEVMSYEHMIDFAEKRHLAFFKALGIENI